MARLASTPLLPVEHHHVVFTLPAELGELTLANPAFVYALLMRSAAATLRDVAAHPKRLGATIGVLMVLHTWGQNLHRHPHVHCVVSGVASWSRSCPAVSSRFGTTVCWPMHSARRA